MKEGLGAAGIRTQIPEVDENTLYCRLYDGSVYALDGRGRMGWGGGCYGEDSKDENSEVVHALITAALTVYVLPSLG